MIADESDSESEEGENYFVSMTDMMVGVLFIFIIMLMIFALDFRTKTDVQNNAIDVAREVGHVSRIPRAFLSQRTSVSMASVLS